MQSLKKAHTQTCVMCRRSINLLRTDAARELRGLVGIRRLTNIARSVTAEIRTLVRNNDESLQRNGNYAEDLLAEAVRRMEASARHEGRSGIKTGDQCDWRAASYKPRPSAVVASGASGHR